MEKIDNERIKPNVGAVYNYGWEIMKKYFLPLFLVIILVSVISSPISMMEGPEEHHPSGIILRIFGLAFILFVVNPIEYGADYMFLKAVRNIQFDVKELFDVFKNYLNVVLAALLAGSIIFIGFILLVVPGIVFACRLAFVPYLVMDKKIDPVKAVEESWRLTKGYGWRIFGMALLAFPILIAGLIALVVGVFVSIMWINAAFAAMYQAVLEEKGEYEGIVEPVDNNYTE